MTDVLLVDKREHVTIFTMNRPEKHNAMSPELTDALGAGFLEFNEDPSQYVAIVTGAGDRAFSAGADLSGRGVGNPGPDGGSRRPTPYLITDMSGVGASPKPVLAAVNGLAVGGGFETALACDIRIASDNAWFGLFEPKRGIIAGVAVHLLPRMVAYGDAAWMLLTAERVSAEEALRVGLVQAVVPQDQLLDEALRVADVICQLSQNSVRVMKRVMRLHRDLLLKEGINLSEAMHDLMRIGGDAAEGMEAFNQKRDPSFANNWPAS